MGKLIIFDEQKKVFHLKNNFYSYVIQIVMDKYLLHRYWGKPLREFRDSAALTMMDRGFSPQPEEINHDRRFSLDVLPREYPDTNHGDFRTPAYQIMLADGTTATEFGYNGYRIYEGKPAIKGQPHSFDKAGQCETLEIELISVNNDLNIFLNYTIFPDSNALVRSVKFVNIGTENVKLLNAGSLSLDFTDHDFIRYSLYGGHAAERSLERSELFRGIQENSSTRGASSHQQSPFIALARRNADEHQGDVYGFSLIYSGNFSIRTEVEQFGTTRVVAGINPANFTWTLEKGESFETPEGVMVYSADGLNGMSKCFHNFWQKHLVRSKHVNELRPILVNNWEATYFDFNEEKILELADCAKELGIELVVLDDGWFGKRNDDNSSLGDWFVNREKLPAGVAGISEKVRAKGLKFGLWVEPEMVSVDSDLFRAHPDWTIHSNAVKSSYGRNQLILDLGRAEVREYVIKVISDAIKEAKVDYIKWDMNRHMTEPFSNALTADRQLEASHRYIMGVYEIMEAITSRFPDILFESCSGGGGRFDAGMMYYMPQAWVSDNTDAVCRLKIQTGTSLVFPPATMGCHVSVVPNHQVGRITPLNFRGLVAMCGAFGYEMDICRMSDEDKAEVKEQIKLFKDIRPMVQQGEFTRLKSPFDGNDTAWSFTSKDGSRMAVMYFRILSQMAPEVGYLKLQGLEPNALYRISTFKMPEHAHEVNESYLKSNDIEGKEFYGDELMNFGLTITPALLDFAAYMWIIEKIG